MTISGDDLDEMRHDDDADRVLTELLAGTLAEDHPVASLRVVVDELRAAGRVAPQPNAALAVMLQDGLSPTELPAGTAPTVVTIPRPASPVRIRIGGFAGRVAALSMAAKLVLGVGAAAAAVGGAGVAGVLPQPAQDVVNRAFGLSGQVEEDAEHPSAQDDWDGVAPNSDAVEGEADDAGVPAEPDAADFGHGVSGDAQGEDGQPGVDGPSTAGQARPDGGDAADAPGLSAPPAQPPLQDRPDEAGGRPGPADDDRPANSGPPAIAPNPPAPAAGGDASQASGSGEAPGEPPAPAPPAPPASPDANPSSTGGSAGSPDTGAGSGEAAPPPGAPTAQGS